jgi:DNA-binding IclR family transcriptional regulator
MPVAKTALSRPVASPHKSASKTPASGADMPLRAGIQSVEVGFELLKALSNATGALMLRDLASAAGMSAAKAHRYLVSFQRMGLVLQDPVSTRYDLGPAALRLGLASLSRIDGVRLARERVPALLAETGHTVAIAVWGNQGPTMVHWAEAPQTVPVTLRLGDVMPLLTSATGRCFAAFMGVDGRDAQGLAPMIRDELARTRKLPQSGANLTDIPLTQQDVQAMLLETRQRGLGRVINSLLPGVGGFCAPVFDAQGRLALGLVVLGSVTTLDTGWDSPPARALLHCAQQLSAELGHKPERSGP